MNDVIVLNLIGFVAAGLAGSLILRYAGVLNLCGGSIAGGFGYTYAVASPHVGVIAGILISTLFGFICALTLLALWDLLRRESFELSTLGIAILTEELFKHLPSITGGVSGLVGIPIPFGASKAHSLLLLILCVGLGGACLVCAYWALSGHRRTAAILRLTSRVHAESIGLTASQSHRALFFVSTMGFGLLGWSLVWSVRGIHPDSIGLSLNLRCLMAGVLFDCGGKSLVLGVLFCLLFASFEEALRFFPWTGALVASLQQLVASAALIFLLCIRRPQRSDVNI